MKFDPEETWIETDPTGYKVLKDDMFSFYIVYDSDEDNKYEIYNYYKYDKSMFVEISNLESYNILTGKIPICLYNGKYFTEKYISEIDDHVRSEIEEFLKSHLS